VNKLSNAKNTNVIFGKRLRELREEYGLLQENVGNWFSMGKSTISQWESGRLPHATIIIELSKRFNVTTDYLLGLSSNKRNIEIASDHHIDDPIQDLPEEARKSLEEFKRFLFEKHGVKD
jgi:transcriptional regulator with XRE-family HTH domain